MNDDEIDKIYEKLYEMHDANRSAIKKANDRVLKLIIQENKNSEHIRAALDDINQLYLLFNELLRSNKKDKDDG